MKGTKDFPQCGFSNTIVQILNSLNVPFETINILENELLRQGLKEYSSWPTFPQLYIDGEFFGGCDITVGEYLLLSNVYDIVNSSSTDMVACGSPLSPKDIFTFAFCMIALEYIILHV